MRDSELQELQKETFLIVVILVGFLALTLAYINLLTISLIEPFYLIYLAKWMPSAVALITCGYSYWLYKRDHFRLGTYIFIGGLIISVTSFMLWPNLDFSHREAYLLLLVVAMAGLLITPKAAAQTAAFAVVSTLGTAFFLYGSNLHAYVPLIVPLTMTWAMAAVSWISSGHLTTTLQWAMESQAKAQLRSRELFESQRETQKAYQLLETTNIRLKEAEAAAVQANEFKTRFITNLSHELRTPLSAIINFSFILSKGHLGQVTPEQSDYLVRIHDAGNLLLDIVNDLLDLAKIEAGQMELFLEPVDLEDVSTGIITTVSGLITDRPIELRQEIEPDLPKIVGDSTRIRQILLNLLGNAAKYTDEGHIILRISKNKDFVTISVSDTGIGIKPEDTERIFEEFQQTEEAFAMRKVGTGLGLPISKKFVELHGGKLWVESTYKQGSTFYVTLPVAAQNIETTTVNAEQQLKQITDRIATL